MTDPVEAAVARRWEPGMTLVDTAEQVARASYDMAVRFHRGGTLLAFGTGPDAATATHLAVELAHPATPGRRGLPAASAGDAAGRPAGDSAGGSAGHEAAFPAHLRMLGRRGDIAVAVATGQPAPQVQQALATARELGMLTVALTTGPVEADHLLVARTDDPRVAREIHVTTHHILSEMVHAFLDRPALLEVST